MKRRTTTVSNVKLRPHWWSGYVGDINGVSVRFVLRGRQWRARVKNLFIGSSVIASASTLRECVSAVRSSPL